MYIVVVAIPVQIVQAVLVVHIVMDLQDVCLIVLREHVLVLAYSVQAVDLV